MSMNPPAKAPSQKATAAAAVRRGAVRYADVLLFLGGIVTGFILGQA